MKNNLKNSLKTSLRKTLTRCGLILSAWMGISISAQAQECQVNTSGINFGEFNPLTNQVLDRSGTFRLLCRNPTQQEKLVHVCIGLREGSAGVSVDNRRMQSSVNTLSYQLYQNPNHTQLWGDFASGQHWRITRPIAANTDWVVIADPPIYGRIFSGQQNIVPGGYSSKFILPGHIELAYTFIDPPGLASCFGSTAPSFTFTEFGIDASVPDRCEIIGGPLPLDFGTVSGLEIPNTTAVTRVDVRCTQGTMYDVELNDGAFSPAPGQRRMRNISNPGHDIAYDIYSDSALSNRWGSLAAGEGHQDGPVIGTGVGFQTFLGYGLVPAQTAPSVGLYQDRVILTVHY